MIKYAGTTKEQVIQKLRETREKLWAEKMAAPVQFEMKASFFLTVSSPFSIIFLFKTKLFSKLF